MLRPPVVIALLCTEGKNRPLDSEQDLSLVGGSSCRPSWTATRPRSSPRSPSQTTSPSPEQFAPRPQRPSGATSLYHYQGIKNPPLGALYVVDVWSTMVADIITSGKSPPGAARLEGRAAAAARAFISARVPRAHACALVEGRKAPLFAADLFWGAATTSEGPFFYRC